MVGTFSLVLFFTMIKEAYEVPFTPLSPYIGFLKIQARQRRQWQDFFSF
jgi:hypothetical protein